MPKTTRAANLLRRTLKRVRYKHGIKYRLTKPCQPWTRLCAKSACATIRLR